MSMTRQEQLDAVVRNYGVWPEPNRFKELPNMAAWRDGEVLFSQLSLGRHTFTRAEVETRKAILQNKPSWNYAPKGARILIYSPVNRAWLFGSFENAEIGISGCDWAGIGIGDWFIEDGFKGEVIGDWRDTLEKRPEEKIESTVENWESGKLGQSEEHVQVVNIDLGDIEKPTPEEEEAFNMLEARNGECIGGSTAEWDGEGLPPIGAECYVQLAFNDMGKCRITYIGDGVFCYRQNSSGNEYTGSVRDTVFRPIKSDREQWVEDCEEFITGYATWEAAAAAMYDGFKSGKLKLPEVE